MFRFNHGEAINLKTGVTGDVAYNVIYSQAEQV
jgi:hypothetical protein